jgi:hypothetical protein
MTWGHRYKIALEAVDITGFPTPVSGGPHANLYGHPSDGIISDGDPSQRLRAGDRVEALVRAHPPQ